MDHDDCFKLLLVGNAGSGKSSTMMRYADRTFSEAYTSTIGVDFRAKTVCKDGKRIKLQIWDTAGQCQFRCITTSYYRGAHGIFFMYDMTDALSFVHLCEWIKEAETHTESKPVYVLVGSKCDLAAARKVSLKEAQSFAKLRNMQYIEVSAKNGQGVERMFQMMVDSISSGIPPMQTLELAEPNHKHLCCTLL